METEEIQDDVQLEETLSDAPVEQPAEQEQVEEAPPVEAQKETTSNLRFKTIREAREKTERENEALRYRIEHLEEQQNQQQKPQYDSGVAPDDFVEGKHLSKYDKRMQELENKMAVQREQMITSQLRSQFNDFDNVVNKENMDMLSKIDPEAAATISGSRADMYSTAVTAYKAIKNSGIVEDTTYDRQHARAKANVSKPRPTASVSPKTPTEGPIARANVFAGEFTEEEKQSLYAQAKANAMRR